jgi:hypothetical protein
MKIESSFSKMRTSGLIVERRRPSVALSVDLASHMSFRCANGTIAVVTSHPQALMSSVCKQWLRLIRRAQREKASTLNHQRRNSLDEIIHSMQVISFTAKDPLDEPLAYVSFATVEQLTLTAPTCATMYITEPITKLSQYTITAWMSPDSLVVIYDK